MNLLRRFENHVWHPFATDRHPLGDVTPRLVLPYLILPHHRLLRHGIAYQPDAGVCGVAVDAGILFCFRIPLNPVRGSLSVAEGIPSRTHNPVWGCTFRVFIV